MVLSLRPVRIDDEEFLFQVYASTRAEEMAIVPWNQEQKHAFLEMQFNAQRQSYLKEFPSAEYKIIEDDGVAAGRLIVDRSDQRILIIDIALLPEHRRKGIGSSLINDLKSEAERTGKPLRLDVESFNPAYHLYDRLGFRKIDEMSFYWRLEWRANEEVAA
jgi:ribosomal protein S18 acetylase RimI-like enzyme